MVYRVVIGVYGLVNILGGLMAFLAPTIRSQKSLIVGGISGLLLLYLAWLGETKPAFAFRGAALVALGLGCFWVYRITEVVAQGKSTMMPMMNLVLAVGVILVIGAGHMMKAKKSASTQADMPVDVADQNPAPDA